MAWTCHPHAIMFQTNTEPSNNHVLELLPVPMGPPMSSPCTRTPSLGRNRRCTAGRHAVEHLACTISPSHPEQTRARPTRPRPPAACPRHPCTPQARPRASAARTSPPRLVPVPHAAWPRHHRAAEGCKLPSAKSFPGAAQPPSRLRRPGRTFIHHPESDSGAATPHE